MKKIIALDIDGTLYNRDKKITPATKEALLQAQEKGCILVLASGRPTAGLKPIADELKMDQYHGLLLAYNGGVVTDYTTGRVIYSNTIPNLLARRLLRHLEASPVNPIVDDGTTIYTTDPQSFQVPYESSSNHLNIRINFQKCSEAVSYNSLVVHYQYPNFIHIATSFYLRSALKYSQ